MTDSMINSSTSSFYSKIREVQYDVMVSSREAAKVANFKA
jgi:hypothetical protein